MGEVSDKSEAFINEVAEAGGSGIKLCYQCGTCTGDCPTAFAMDYTPRQIIRMVRLGMREEVLSSNTIWVCATCYNCTTRCPRGVKITEVMSALKGIAIREGIEAKNPKGPAFYKTFLEISEKYGRMFEAEFMLRFISKVPESLSKKVSELPAQLPLGIELLKKGKFAFSPHRIKGLERFQSIYKKVGRGSK